MKLFARNLVLAASLLTATAAFAQSSWKIDAAHSQAEFTIRHMGISNVHGRFSNINGTVVLDEKDLSKSSVNATVDTTTVDTGVAQRDGHLKSPDFFDVAKFPTMTFVSKSVERDGDDYKVNGDLTLHGVTKPVVLHLDAPEKEITGMDGKPHRGFSATTTIHRQDFGLVWNGTLKSGDSVLGDDVKISLDIEAAKQ
ncbi:YceI family protein [Silvibacterium dinghuense]|uniref:Polyisoprenoid-binding protein n=1 Tax=Silvibacterium dinghuense TaxID=1560006 RepID=A0A4V1NVP7_9BACT|nr:YceI family protein [Silvibacterium dinghuense]RXS96662.1 polyisoprenoid-binding protein [Silvibacterium dinghuense]GGG92625.1 polyisoprenoid-binding protein [Silvibacterium dinghuense]